VGLVSTAAATAAAKSANGCSGRWELASLCDCFWGSVAGGLNARPEARNRDCRRQKLKPRRTSLAVRHSPPNYFVSPQPSLNLSNQAFVCGSGVLLRVRALDSSPFA
jgi:hypothetical protein